MPVNKIKGGDDILADQQNNLTEQHGLLAQRQTGFCVVRVRTRAGNITSNQLHKVAELADKYGRGQLHFTTRQSVEMYWVPEGQLGAVLQEIDDAGLLPAIRGPRMRTVVACPGALLCKYGMCDTIALATHLDKSVVGRKLPTKTKIGISGCPNSCSKPQENDIGLQGVMLPKVVDGCVGCRACLHACKVKAIAVQNCTPRIDFRKCVGCGLCVTECPKNVFLADKQGYRVYVGGRIGKKPKLGTKILALIPEMDAYSYIQTILDAYESFSNQGERISDVVKRLGIVAFRQETLNKMFPKKMLD